MKRKAILQVLFILALTIIVIVTGFLIFADLKGKYIIVAMGIIISQIMVAYSLYKNPQRMK